LSHTTIKKFPTNLSHYHSQKIPDKLVNYPYPCAQKVLVKLVLPVLAPLSKSPDNMLCYFGIGQDLQEHKGDTRNECSETVIICESFLQMMDQCKIDFIHNTLIALECFPFSEQTLRVIAEFAVEEWDLLLSADAFTADQPHAELGYYKFPVTNLETEIFNINAANVVMPGYTRPCFCTKRGSGSLVNIVIAIPDDVKLITTIFLLTDSWNEQRCSHAFVRFSDEDPTMTTDKKYRPRTKPTEKGWYGPVLSSYCHEIKKAAKPFFVPDFVKAKYMLMQVHAEKDSNYVSIYGILVRGVLH